MGVTVVADSSTCFAASEDSGDEAKVRQLARCVNMSARAMVNARRCHAFSAIPTAMGVERERLYTVPSSAVRAGSTSCPCRDRRRALIIARSAGLSPRPLPSRTPSAYRSPLSEFTQADATFLVALKTSRLSVNGFLSGLVTSSTSR